MNLNILNEKIDILRSSLIKNSQHYYQDFPWRNETSPFHSLIAEILLQRTKAEQVVPIYYKFKITFKTVEDLSNSSIKKILSVIGSLGLHWRAHQLKKLAEYLVKHCDSNIPDEFDKLIKLPGVGHYAASAYLSLHKNIRASIVDSNIVRFYSRYFGFDATPETRRKRWIIELAEKITPRDNFKEFNYALLDFTRNICRPTPFCNKCFLSSDCNYFNLQYGKKDAQNQ